MPQDAFTLKFIAKELSTLLVGGEDIKNHPTRERTGHFYYIHRKGFS